MRATILLCALSVFLPLQFVRAAAPSVWSGLVLATNEDHPKEAPLELRKFKTKLENVFGYNQLELIGQHTESMDDPLEHWLIPSKNFCLRVDAKPLSKIGWPLRLQIFEDKKLLAHFDANLGPQSPLFIRGPLYAGGQLIIILLVK